MAMKTKREVGPLQPAAQETFDPDQRSPERPLASVCPELHFRLAEETTVYFLLCIGLSFILRGGKCLYCKIKEEYTMLLPVTHKEEWSFAWK